MTTVERLTGCVLVAALITGVAACGSDDQPTREEVIAQLEGDPRTSDAPEGTTRCLADWYLTYATAEQLNALMTGGPETPAPPQVIGDDEQAKEALVDCLKTAS